MDHSYFGLDLKFLEVDLVDILHKVENNTEHRIYQREYRVDHAHKCFKVLSKKHVLTYTQINDLMSDFGFKTDIIFGAVHNSDLTAAANIHGYIIPLWRKIARLLHVVFKIPFHVLTSKYGPGRARLHIRLFQDVDGSWFIISHVDKANWFNIFDPLGLIKSHLKDGTGDYSLGHRYLGEIVTHIRKCLASNRVVAFDFDSLK